MITLNPERTGALNTPEFIARKDFKTALLPELVM
jgi:hypothetical protein